MTTSPSHVYIALGSFSGRVYQSLFHRAHALNRSTLSSSTRTTILMSSCWAAATAGISWQSCEAGESLNRLAFKQVTTLAAHQVATVGTQKRDNEFPPYHLTMLSKFLVDFRSDRA